MISLTATSTSAVQSTHSNRLQRSNRHSARRCAPIQASSTAPLMAPAPAPVAAREVLRPLDRTCTSNNVVPFPRTLPAPDSVTDDAAAAATTSTSASTITASLADVPLSKLYAWVFRPGFRGAMLAATTAQALVPAGAGIPLAAPALAFCVAYFTYNYDHVKDCTSEHDAANQSDRTAFYAANEALSWATVGASAAASVALAVAMPGAAALTAMVTAMCGLAALYTVPLPFLGGESLRTCTGVKTLFNMFGWVTLCVATPAIAVAAAAAMGPGGASLDWAALAAMVGHVAVTRLTCLFNDIRDADGDAAEGTMTLPVVWGKRRTLAVVATANVAEAAFKVTALGPMRAAPLLAANALHLAQVAVLKREVDAEEAAAQQQQQQQVEEQGAAAPKKAGRSSSFVTGRDADALEVLTLLLPLPAPVGAAVAAVWFAARGVQQLLVSRRADRLINVAVV